MCVKLLVSAALASFVLAVSAGAAAPSRSVLIIGDSVATGMLWHKDAIAVVQKDLEVEWQVAICRSVAGMSCPFDGERPVTLVDLVGARTDVPPIVVVEAGYNDSAATFAADVDAAMTVLLAKGAKHVLWLTMPAGVPPYADLDAALRRAEGRWPQLQLVDWSSASAGHYDWFQTDFIHLRETGGLAMAHLVHAAVLALVDPLRVSDRPLLLHDGRAYSMRLRALGGAPPYRWRVASGRPPHGFHLLADGTLSAAPRVGSRSSVVLSVTDADGTTATLSVLAR